MFRAIFLARRNKSQETLPSEKCCKEGSLSNFLKKWVKPKINPAKESCSLAPFRLQSGFMHAIALLRFAVSALEGDTMNTSCFFVNCKRPVGTAFSVYLVADIRGNSICLKL